jgi:hypothetical protein
MNKKVIAAVLIAVLGALTLSNGPHTALAQGPSGVDYTKAEYSADPINHVPYYCECWHDELGLYGFDTMAGIGVTARYDMDDSTPAFNYSHWFWDAQAGYSWDPWFPDSYVIMDQPTYCTRCIDYNEPSQSYCQYSDWDNPAWGNPNNADHYCWYVHTETEMNSVHLHSVEGETQAQFHLIGLPEYTWWIIVYTTNPSDPGPDSFAFLTARD